MPTRVTPYLGGTGQDNTRKLNVHPTLNRVSIGADVLASANLQVFGNVSANTMYVESLRVSNVFITNVTNQINPNADFQIAKSGNATMNLFSTNANARFDMGVGSSLFSFILSGTTNAANLRMVSGTGVNNVSMQVNEFNFTNNAYIFGNTFAFGRVAIGRVTPTANLHVNGNVVVSGNSTLTSNLYTGGKFDIFSNVLVSTDIFEFRSPRGIAFPSDTTANRSNKTGVIRYNSDLSLLEYTNDGSAWPALVGNNNVQTLTNKRINFRIFSTTSASSVTPDISTYDMYTYTALAATLTINATTGGTPLNGDKLTFRFKDDGTPRTLSWITSGTNSFRVIGVTLPTTTTANKVTYVGCIYNSAKSYWDVIAVTTQA